ncbi:hypothetical protein [Methanolobus vulcani]|uniref:Uncharacterized protein n=1 Tax=Methanolobus vulcani TaxID=38026 RepID=A0A7Z8P205_9EURY|nr:hypothetical protein [Methanolobus vulcani]TQD25065.1 hypothetical protein FKV42_08385 [Methanolobus vulcani]
MKMRKQTTMLLVSILMFSLIAGCITDDSTLETNPETLEVDRNNPNEDSQATTSMDNITW